MDFKIDKNRGAVGVRHEGSELIKANSTESVDGLKATLLRKPESARKEDLASYGAESAATGDNRVIGNIKSILSTKNDVLDSILNLKTRQLNLAREAVNLPYASTLQVTAQTEVSQIRQTVTDLQEGSYSTQAPRPDGSQTMLTGQTYTYSSPHGEIRDAISSGPIASQDASKFGILHPSEATATATIIEGEIVSYRANKTAYGAALDKADQLDPKKTKEVFTMKETRPNALESVEEAQQLAKSVADKLGSAYGNEQTVSKLIESSTEGLSLDRVKNLLS